MATIERNRYDVDWDGNDDVDGFDDDDYCCGGGSSGGGHR